MSEQHDDHVSLTIGGERWTIRKVEGPWFTLRGRDGLDIPIDLSRVRWEVYCAAAERRLRQTDQHLTIWTIYHDPSDHPGKWVLRGFDIPGGMRPGIEIADTLDEIRKKIPRLLFRMPRDPNDDPAIYEVWF